jgi:hypothetical protein
MTTKSDKRKKTINDRFSALEERGLVKFDVVVDECMHDDSYIDTWDVSEEEKAQTKKELWERIGNDGVWGIVGSFRVSTDARWEQGDGVWDFIGDDWRDSGYDTDVKSETMKALDAAFQEKANELAQRATYAAGGV